MIHTERPKEGNSVTETIPIKREKRLDSGFVEVKVGSRISVTEMQPKLTRLIVTEAVRF